MFTDNTVRSYLRLIFLRYSDNVFFLQETGNVFDFLHIEIVNWNHDNHHQVIIKNKTVWRNRRLF